MLAVSADIPLKDPLDIEFKLNRKLAKQLYEREMQEKVRSNKHQRDNIEQQQKNKMHIKELEKAKKIDETLK